MSASPPPQTPLQTPFWSRQRHLDRRPALLARGRIKSALRRWFETQGFVEVETACLQVSPGNETHIHGFATELIDNDGAAHRRYLHSSPEFACKKLLAAGEEKLFTFAPVFRNGERSALHHPEFTMLEWYRTRAPYEILLDDCQQILKIAATTTGQNQFSHKGRRADALVVPERLSVAQAFQRFAAIDLLASCNGGGAPDREALAEAALAKGFRVADDDDWSDIFSRILVQAVEPNLGNERATLLIDYPIHEAALARPSPNDPRVAERFELYACGVELANGFGELTDPVEQRRRFEADMTERRRRYGAAAAYPIDDDFIAALTHMPPASGCALGFDRLVMLAVGAPNIDAVIWTPLPEAVPPHR